MCYTLHTGLFTKNAELLLEHVMQYGANKRGANGRAFRYANIEQLADGEIVFNIDNDHYSWRRAAWSKFKDDAGRLELIAWTLKSMIQSRLPLTMDIENREWSRDNLNNLYWSVGGTTHVFSVTIQEVYYVYEALRARKNYQRHYQNADELTEKWVGAKRDAVATELETARREEIKKLNDEYQKLKTEVRAECENEITRIIRELKQKRDERIIELDTELNQKLEELNKMCEDPELAGGMLSA